ncbi:hypothetical protein IQ266_21250 [filamentous cyanobacterium LEGE 11480]|uniref:Peptidase M50 domain-containing protein n=1 Tax=Romeriopsis navalis LEGE 11480 TaxID=2777977 RepID=A0A928Z4Z8_9CYAN|nr:site-2 protease family protein [Romeriopsis navalis]MBE9032269.1 hypothetical protein [Romeriopsis navalis LEGE 11480]
MLNLIVFLPVVLILLQVVALYLQAQRLLQIRFRYPRYEVQPVCELSLDLKQAFKPTIAQLKQLGFRLCGAYRTQKIFHFDHADERAMLLYHPQHQTFAEVEIRLPADRQDLVSVNFYQRFQDKTWLLTMNGQAHGMIDRLPDTIVVDPYCASLVDQWRYHQAQCREIAKDSQTLKPAAFLTALQKMQQRYVDRLLAEKQLRVSREGWFLSGKSAFNTALKLRQGLSKVRQRQTARQRLIAAQPELLQAVPLSLQIQTFQRLRELETNHRDLRLGKWVLFGSLALFILLAIALPDNFGTWKTGDLFNLLGVLFLHEAGHFLAMKLFGYQDTKMFFLPMFGAAVTGRKADASLSEKIWVLLAGPLPGLLLGFGLIGLIQFNAGFSNLENLAWMLITLNIINLLPIYPLDGGKVAQHLLFSRYPWADVVFKIFTVLLFGGLGWVSPPLLLLAVATALSIPNSYRTAKLNLEIQQRIATANGDPAPDFLTVIFQQMAQSGYGQLPVAKQDAIAKDLIERQRETNAPWLSRVGLASIYCLSLLVGVGGTVIAAFPKANEAMAASRPITGDLDSLQRANRMIQQQPDRATAYLQRARVYQSRFARRATEASKPGLPAPDQFVNGSVTAAHPGYPELQKALNDYDTAIRLESDNVALYQLRSQLQILMGQPEKAIADYGQLIQRAPQNALFYIDRAELYQAIGRHQAAIRDASQAIKLKADQPYAYELRSQAKQAIGDQPGARADQQKANQLSTQIMTAESR